MSNSGVRIAVHSFAVCVHDVNKWMRARRLGLNPTKTQVMWLGSGQQLKHVGMLTSTTSRCCRPYTVQVVESARDLGVILHSRLTLSAHVAALCRSSWLLPAQTPSTRPINGKLQEPQLRRLFPAGWIIAIRCSMGCRTFYCTSCSLRRMTE